MGVSLRLLKDGPCKKQLSFVRLTATDTNFPGQDFYSFAAACFSLIMNSPLGPNSILSSWPFVHPLASTIVLGSVMTYWSWADLWSFIFTVIIRIDAISI